MPGEDSACLEVYTQISDNYCNLRRLGLIKPLNLQAWYMLRLLSWPTQVQLISTKVGVAQNFSHVSQAFFQHGFSLVEVLDLPSL